VWHADTLLIVFLSLIYQCIVISLNRNTSGLGNISAVVLLPFFVYSLKLGLTGAAIATIASQYLGMFLLLWSLSRRAVLLPPKIEDLEFVGYIKSGELSYCFSPHIT